MRTATIAALAAALALSGCKVEVKDSGELPKVNVEPGTMPDVKVSTDSVQMPNLKVPEIKTPDVKLPDVEAPRIELPGTRRDTARHDTTHRRP